MKKVIRLFIPLAVCVAAGTIFYNISSSQSKNYPNVFLNPPKVVFPIAWSILYVLIGLSIYFFDRDVDDKETKDKGLALYYFDLLFNALWTLFFFTLNMKVFSSIWLAGLYLIVIIRFYYFKKNSKVSAYLLLPYLGWLVFALYLNIAVNLA